MRHRHGQRKLNITDGAHRRALLQSLGNALIKYENIKTTLPRAKELRRFLEPLVNLGKKPSVAARRLAFSRLRDRDSVVKIFDDLGERVKNRPGGYVRILKCGFRRGDSAPMAMVEFVDKKAEVSAKEIKKSPKAKETKPNKSDSPTELSESTGDK